ncbi:MAG: hypothetical protein HOQ24_13105 [Mycobacteriaceae bacterium]|nr:hypothetical protein [Mycobacteriaceae bacterium]
MGDLFGRMFRRHAWYESYPLTAEDERFMWRLYGHTLLPTLIRLPSGRSTTGEELRAWFRGKPSLRRAQ